jgi:predicted esterase
MICLDRPNPKGRVLMLHGLGGGPELYAETFEQSHVLSEYSFYFPEGPKGPCDWIGVDEGVRWFNIKKSGDRDVREDVKTSATVIHNYIREYNIDVIGGFS